MAETTVSPDIPRLRLAFRVGVVGHRPNRLPADRSELRRVVVSIPQAVTRAVVDGSNDLRSIYAGDPPALRVISSLAEGSGRPVARARPRPLRRAAAAAGRRRR